MKTDKRIRFVKTRGKAKSPGTKYRHYSPKAKVVLVRRVSKNKLNKSIAYIGVRSLLPVQRYKLGMYRHCKSKLDYAKSLFSFFRECDAKRIRIIYAERLEEKGIGLAVMNRLKKAAL